MIKQATAETATVRSERLSAARLAQAAKKLAVAKEKAVTKAEPTPPAILEVKKRKKRAPKKAPESVPA